MGAKKRVPYGCGTLLVLLCKADSVLCFSDNAFPYGERAAVGEQTRSLLPLLFDDGEEQVLHHLVAFHVGMNAWVVVG